MKLNKDQIKFKLKTIEPTVDMYPVWVFNVADTAIALSDDLTELRDAVALYFECLDKQKYTFSETLKKAEQQLREMIK